MADTTPSVTPISQKHEGYEVRLRPLLTAVGVLASVTIVVLLLMGWLFKAFSSRHDNLPMPLALLAETQQPPPMPRLQVAPQSELQQLRASEEKQLREYGWVNPAAGIVHIPIERAIALYVDRTTRQQQAQEATGDTRDKRP